MKNYLFNRLDQTAAGVISCWRKVGPKPSSKQHGLVSKHSILYFLLKQQFCFAFE